MAGHGKPSKNEALAILERRKKVAELYIRGKTQYAIAAELGVKRSCVMDDLTAVRRMWQESAVMAMDQRKAEELARIDAIEEAAWGGWERSCRDSETLHAETTKGRVGRDGKPVPDLSRTAKTVKGQAGDPRFLERVGWCVERRCKILGLDAPQKSEHEVTVDERRDRLLGILAALRERAGNPGDRTPFAGIGDGDN